MYYNINSLAVYVDTGIYSNYCIVHFNLNQRAEFFHVSTDFCYPRWTPSIIRIRPGTRIGIVRYDGRNLRPLQYNANDTVKLSSRLIIAMTKDMSGSFWIDHESLAIDRLDPANEKIEHISDRPLFQKNPFRLARQRWTTDELGNLWCAAENGSLYYFNWKENKVNHYTKKTSGVLSDSVWAFLQDPDHSMWMLTRQGLSRFHPGSGQFTHFPLPILASLDNAVPLIKRKNGFLV